MINYTKIAIGTLCAISVFTYFAINDQGIPDFSFGEVKNSSNEIATHSILVQPDIQLTEIRRAEIKTSEKSEPPLRQESTDEGAPDPDIELAGKSRDIESPRKSSDPVKQPERRKSVKSPVSSQQHAAIKQTVTRPARPMARSATRPGNISGTKEIRFDRPQRIEQWGKVYFDLLSQTNDLKHCINNTRPCSNLALKNWADQIRPLQNLSPREKIQAVNHLANQRPFRTDMSQYGFKDHWAAPSEFLTTAGDCEDYAILKYASLMALGFENRDLRLVVGNITGVGSHAFLAVNVDGNEVLLDNRTGNISVAASRFDFQPKHSMNLSYRWVHVSGGKKSQTI